jgi:hypothetical protein
MKACIGNRYGSVYNIVLLYLLPVKVTQELSTHLLIALKMTIASILTLSVNPRFTTFSSLRDNWD